MSKAINLFNLAALTTACAVFLASTTDVAAQNAQNCGPREMVLQRLSEGFGEARQSMGLGANNAVVEVYASLETGTWTITVTMPGGMTCLVASGRAFEEFVGALPETDSDA